MVPGSDDEHDLKHHDGDDHQHQNTLNDATMKQIMMEKKKGPPYLSLFSSWLTFHIFVLSTMMMTLRMN